MLHFKPHALVYMFLLAAGLSLHLYADEGKPSPAKPKSTVCAKFVGLTLGSIADPGFIRLFQESEKRTLFAESVEERKNHTILPKEQASQLMEDASTLLRYREEVQDIESRKVIDEYIYMCHLIVVAHNQKLINGVTKNYFIEGKSKNEFLTELSLAVVEQLKKYDGSSRVNTFMGPVAKNMGNNLIRGSISRHEKQKSKSDLPQDNSKFKNLDPLESGTLTRDLRRYTDKRSNTAIKQSTVIKLRNFIADHANFTDRQMEMYLAYRGLLDDSPRGGVSLIELSEKYNVSKATIRDTVYTAEGKFRDAVKRKNLTMEDFLP